MCPLDEAQPVGNGQGSTREEKLKGRDAPRYPALFEGVQSKNLYDAGCLSTWVYDNVGGAVLVE
ncbi:hypothetical protein [Vitiosangium sp. GDMCC 1.1324]|uniref:hypothetical protein n=1 Tax=Vitiosangium sp. (strain GDMCC 1.1324) TaxID=2138576 RepID=UPI000D353E23|nr:hypothetical protein [Vitiosangium sp. GDMCC 1.1324]PTL79983.1 hypothetical protein DAT35_31680 [Vitiosangium sp. GDMCC 1.1324]